MIVKKKSKSRKAKLNEIQTKISTYFNKKPLRKSKNKRRKNSLKENLNCNKLSLVRKSSKNLKLMKSRDNSSKTTVLNQKKSKDKNRKKSISILYRNKFPQFQNNLFQQVQKKHQRIHSIYNSNSNLSQLRKKNKNFLYCSTRNIKNVQKKSKSKQQSRRSQSRVKALLNTKQKIQIDPQFCLENQVEIFKFLVKKQQNQTNSDFFLFEKQPDITLESRNYMIEWITELADNFKLLPKTLFITLDVLDIYINVFKVSKFSLQLLGISVLFSFSKHEEIYPPTVNDYLNACNQNYKDKDIYEVEAEIFELLEYDLNRVTVLDFYYIISKTIGLTTKEDTFGINIFKMCYKHPEIQTNSKSLIAFSVCYFLCRITNHIFLRKKRFGQKVYFCYEESNPNKKSIVLLKEVESDVRQLSLKIQNIVKKFFQFGQQQRLFENCLKEIDYNKCKGNYFFDLNSQKIQKQINQFHEQ